MNLNDFCCKDDYRDYLREPFSIGDRTIATDGSVLISVPRCTDNEAIGSFKDAIKRLLNELQDQEFMPLPDVSMPDQSDCPGCKGTGHAKRTECPECEGEGEAIAETDHNEYEVLCKTCKGDGFVLSSVGDENEQCENCGGTGKIYDRYSHVKVNGVAVQPKYLSLIKDEPGINVSTGDEKRYLYFRAGYQEGIIMGIHA